MTVLHDLPGEWLTIVERLEESSKVFFDLAKRNSKYAPPIAAANRAEAARYDHEAQVWRQAAAELQRFLPKRRSRGKKA